MRTLFISAVAAGAMFGISTAVEAGSIDLSLSIGGAQVWSVNDDTGSVQTNDNDFGGVFVDNISATWDDEPFINVEFLIDNNTGSDQLVTLVASVDVDPDIIGPTFINGSFQGQSENFPGFPAPTVYSGDNAIYRAFVDNVVVKELADNVSSGAGLSQIPAENYGPEAGPVGAAQMSLVIEFWLPPGADFKATGFFNLDGVVPAPAALAMLGVAGLAGRRRRRD